MDNLLSKLQKIQREMKAPKNLYNKFGNYSYRNAEGILEAFKPYGEQYKVALTVSDDVVVVGERYYIKATATLFDTESDSTISNSAFARESFDKKGQDDSQITGTASSYARKYALNGLFLLDDTKDADTDEYHEETNKKAENEKKVDKPKKATAEQVKEIKELTPDENTLNAMLKYFSVKTLADLTEEQAKVAIARRKEGIKNEQDSTNK